MADVIVLNKADVASAAQVTRATDVVREVNPDAPVVRAASPGSTADVRIPCVHLAQAADGGGARVDHPGRAGRRGGHEASAHGMEPCVMVGPSSTTTMWRPRTAAGSSSRTAVGYDAAQLEALRETIERVPADLVVAATPVDLAHLIPLKKPVIRARYEFAETSGPQLGAIVDAWLARSTTPRRS